LNDLFNAGIRPAINVGISVSRVGGNAQTKAMKQVAGKLKLDLAQYREMAAFSQFESDLDEETKKLLNRGAKVTQVLKQSQNNPYSLEEEVVVLWASHKGLLDLVPVADVESFEKRLLELVHLRGVDILQAIRKEKVLTPEIEKKLESLAQELVSEKE
jgi:F-type H+-transporting ATPase subunit alpha